MVGARQDDPPSKLFRFSAVPLRLNIYWVLIIVIPQHGIGFDVISFVLQVAFIADDVFIIISLPNRNTISATHQVDTI